MFGKSNSSDEPTDVPRCSFCGKTQNDAVELIAGPSVFICTDCVKVCVEGIADAKSGALLTPRFRLL